MKGRMLLMTLWGWGEWGDGFDGLGERGRDVRCAK